MMIMSSIILSSQPSHCLPLLRLPSNLALFGILSTVIYSHVETKGVFVEQLRLGKIIRIPNSCL